ncbi:MAG: hypothetical protein R3D33_00290 [Hyphomicrobiaceae bacterium]
MRRAKAGQGRAERAKGSESRALRRAGRGARLAMMLSLLLLACPATGEAGILSSLLKFGAHHIDDGKGAALRAASGEMGGLVRHLGSLPEAGRRGAIAASALPEGHWRLANAAGETVTAATPEEISNALRWLAPDISDARPGEIALFIDEATVFGRSEALADLPKAGSVRLVHGRESYRVILGGRDSAGQIRAYAELRPRVLVALGDKAAFAEAAWQLGRAANRGAVRILSLDAAGSTSLPRIGARESGTGLPLPETVNPYRIREALGRLGGQDVIVTGRIDGRLLRFQAASGAEQTVVIDDLMAAAADADVNLIVLEGDKALQPGVRNMLWQRIEVGGLGEALKAATMGDFLAALGRSGDRILVAVESGSSGRVRLSARPASAGVPDAAGDSGGALDLGPVENLMSDLVSELTGRVVAAAVRAELRSEERQRELDLRLVPGIPSDLQFGYLGLLVIGVLGLPTAAAWWQRLVPRRPRAAGEGALGHYGRRLASALVFWPLFLPAVAILATPVHYALTTWHVLVGILVIATYPFRWLARLGGAR